MKYRDYKIGFTYEVPDYFSEVRESSYDVFDVAEDTLHYFIQLDDEGEIIRNFSMGAKTIDGDNDIESIVADYVASMEEAGYVKLLENTITTTNGRTIYRYTFYDEDIEEDVGILTYLIKVKDSVITSSCFIKEFYDFYEQEMYGIFDSIQEL